MANYKDTKNHKERLNKILPYSKEIENLVYECVLSIENGIELYRLFGRNTYNQIETIFKCGLCNIWKTTDISDEIFNIMIILATMKKKHSYLTEWFLEWVPNK